MQFGCGSRRRWRPSRSSSGGVCGGRGGPSRRAAALAAVAIILGWVVWRKGRPFAPGEVFRASRLSSGNHLFPTQVLISPTSVVHFTPQWFGRLEHSIHLAHVASVRIDTNVMFSDVYIETTGGASPIRCHGHKKGDATRIQQLIEHYQ